MNINEFKKHLHAVHNTLDDPSPNNQLKDRLNRMNEGPVDKMVEYKPDQTVDKSTDAPTTAAGDSLRPKSKTSEPLKKLKEEEIEIPECVSQYFENYFGDDLNEDTSADDIVSAVNDLIYLCEAVCDAVGLDEGFGDIFATGLEPGQAQNTVPAQPSPIAAVIHKDYKRKKKLLDTQKIPRDAPVRDKVEKELHNRYSRIRTPQQHPDHPSNRPGPFRISRGLEDLLPQKAKAPTFAGRDKIKQKSLQRLRRPKLR